MKQGGKLCECGCNQLAPIAKQTNKRYGHIKGEPVRFINGHNARGNNNPSWNGGTTKDTKGYIYVRMPEHPHSDVYGYIPRSVFIAEKALGKHLPSGAEVHHINGIKDDNRPENLVVCQNRAYHFLLHQKQRAMQACGHPNYRKCRFCHTYDAPDNLYIKGKQVHHRKCDAARKKAWRQAQRTQP